HGDEVVDRVERVKQKVRMKLHLQHLQFCAGQTRLEPRFIQSAFTRLTCVLPQMKTKHHAEESPRIVDKEATQCGQELEYVGNLDVSRYWFTHHEREYERPDRPMYDDENREQKEVQSTAPLPVRQRDRNTIKDPDQGERNNPFQQIVAKRQMQHQRQR